MPFYSLKCFWTFCVARFMFIANMFKELSGGSFIFESNSVESTYYCHYLLFDLK